MQNHWTLHEMSITPNIVMRGRNNDCQEEQGILGEIQPAIRNVRSMATRESPEEMSRMFTENVCMDFDQLILDLVQLLRTL
jgi:hypothetical protein